MVVGVVFGVFVGVAVVAYVVGMLGAVARYSSYQVHVWGNPDAM